MAGRSGAGMGGMGGINCPTCGGGQPVCDRTTGTCVECIDDDNCGGGDPACDLATHECVECNVDAECTEPDNPGCFMHRCEECSRQDHCQTNETCVEGQCRN
jgi:hypothetical protein